MSNVELARSWFGTYRTINRDGGWGALVVDENGHVRIGDHAIQGARFVPASHQLSWSLDGGNVCQLTITFHSDAAGRRRFEGRGAWRGSGPVSLRGEELEPTLAEGHRQLARDWAGTYRTANRDGGWGNVVIDGSGGVRVGEHAITNPRYDARAQQLVWGLGAGNVCRAEVTLRADAAGKRWFDGSGAWRSSGAVSLRGEELAPTRAEQRRRLAQAWSGTYLTTNRDGGWGNVVIDESGGVQLGEHAIANPRFDPASRRLEWDLAEGNVAAAQVTFQVDAAGRRTFAGSGRWGRSGAVSLRGDPVEATVRGRPQLGEHLPDDLAISFRYAKERVHIPFHDSYDVGEGDFSIEVWARVPQQAASPDTPRFLISQGAYDTATQGLSGPGGFYLAFVAGRLRCHAQSADRARRQWVEAKRFVPDPGHWHHVACVRNKGQLHLIIDGHVAEVSRGREGLATGKAAPLESGQPLVLGCPVGTPEGAHDIDISQVRLWNVTRELPAIQAQLHQRLDREHAPESLIGLWNFELDAQRSPLVAVDESRLGNDGTYQGCPILQASGMKLMASGHPYLTVQTQLMQDYRARLPGETAHAERFRCETSGETTHLHTLDGHILGFKLDHSPTVWGAARVGAYEELVVEEVADSPGKVHLRNRDHHYLEFQHHPITWVRTDDGDAIVRLSLRAEPGGEPLGPADLPGRAKAGAPISVQNKEQAFLSVGPLGISTPTSRDENATLTLEAVDPDENTFAIKSAAGTFLSFQHATGVQAAHTRGEYETFTLTPAPEGTYVIRNKDGHCLAFQCAKPDVTVSPTRGSPLTRITHPDGTLSFQNSAGDALGVDGGKVWCRSAFHEFSSYVVVLHPKNPDGTVYTKDHKPCELSVWSHSGAVAALVEGKPVTLSSDAPTPVRADSQGQARLTLSAQDSLHAPVLLVGADFLSGERVTVAPDRHLHHTMANVSASQLKGQPDGDARLPELNGKGALLEPGMHEHAQAVVHVMRSMMHAASEHETHAEHPVHALAAARPAAADKSPSGGAHRAPKAHLTHSDITRAEHLPEAVKTPLRVLKAGAMPHEHFVVDFERGGALEPLSDHQVHQLHQELQPEPRNDMAEFYRKLAQGGDLHHPLVSLTHERYRALHAEHFGTRDLHGGNEGWSVWGWIRSSATRVARVVVSTVKKVVAQVVNAVDQVVTVVRKAVKVVVEKIEDGIKKAAEFVVHTVEEATTVVRDVLKKVKVAVSQAIAFFRRLLGWDDVLEMQSAVRHVVDQTLIKLESSVEFARTRAHRFFASREVWARDKLDDAITQLRGKTLEETRRRHPSGLAHTVRGGWLAATVSSHGRQAQIPFAALQANLSALIQQDLIPAADAFRGKTRDGDSRPLAERLQADLYEGKLKPLLEDPHRLLAGGLGAFLEVMKDTLSLLLELADLAVGTLLDLVQKLIAALRTVLDLEIHFPVITWLYERITRGRDPENTKLTLLNLGALIVAVPATVAYKVAHRGQSLRGHAGLAALKELTAANTPTLGATASLMEGTGGSGATDAADEAMERIKKASTIMTYCAIGASVVWGVGIYDSEVAQALPFPAGTVSLAVFGGGTLVAEIALIGLSTPLGAFALLDRKKGGPSEVLSILAWISLFFVFLSDLFETFVSLLASLTGSLLAPVLYAHAVAVALQTGLTAAFVGFDVLSNLFARPLVALNIAKIFQNFASAIPNLLQFVMFVSDLELGAAITAGQPEAIAALEAQIVWLHGLLAPAKAAACATFTALLTTVVFVDPDHRKSVGLGRL